MGAASGATASGLVATLVHSASCSVPLNGRLPLLSFALSMVGSTRGTGLRDNVAHGQVGRWDRRDRQAHRDDYRDGAHVQVPKYRREGNADPGSGRAREVSAGGHIRAAWSIVRSA